MFDALLRRPSYQFVNRFAVVLQKLQYSEGSLVQPRHRVKDLVKDNCRRKKNKFKKYFIENLFVNEFEATVLEYPQLEAINEVKELMKQGKMLQKQLTSSADDLEAICRNESDSAVATLKKHELTGFKLLLQEKGYGYLKSEYSYILETMDVNPSLTKTLSENEDFGVELVKLYGSAAQKEKHLSNLATGVSMTCFAHSESDQTASSTPIQLNTSAVITADGQNYIVNGKKVWVCNAKHADLIIFSASVPDKKNQMKPALFLIDKKLEGVKISEPIKKMGLHGVDMCEITFESVAVPSECVLGDINKGSEMIKKILINGKLSNSVQSITLMRKLINVAIDYCINNKFFKYNMYERELFNNKIGDLASRLYSVESMAYLMAGRLDSFDDADVFLESLILRIYTSETLQFVSQQCNSIIGPDGVANDEYQELLMDLQYYICCDDTNDHLKLVLGKAGCKHASEYYSTSSAFLKLSKMATGQYMYHLRGYKSPYFVNPLKKLYQYVHLMFESESYALEDCVFNLKLAVDFLLKKYGENILEKEYELLLLGDMVVSIYAMTATLGRASRAYCLCVKHHMIDQNIVCGEMVRLLHEVLWKKKELMRYSNSPLSRQFNSQILNSIGYRERRPVLEDLTVREKRQCEKI